MLGKIQSPSNPVFCLQQDPASQQNWCKAEANNAVASDLVPRRVTLLPPGHIPPTPCCELVDRELILGFVWVVRTFSPLEKENSLDQL